MAGVVVVGWVPGFVGQPLLFRPPAQFFSHVSTMGRLTAGLPESFPGGAVDGQEGWSGKNMHTSVDVIRGLSQPEKTAVTTCPLNRLENRNLAERDAVVVNEQHHVCVGLLEHGIHPEAVVDFEMVLLKGQFEVFEHRRLFAGKAGIRAGPVEGMQLGLQGADSEEASSSLIVPVPSARELPSGVNSNGWSAPWHKAQMINSGNSETRGSDVDTVFPHRC